MTVSFRQLILAVGAVTATYRILGVAENCRFFKETKDDRSLDERGRPLPATTQVAMKQGIYLGKCLSRGSYDRFRFRTMGMLASLGSGSAIADLGNLRFRGGWHGGSGRRPT